MHTLLTIPVLFLMYGFAFCHWYGFRLAGLHRESGLSQRQPFLSASVCALWHIVGLAAGFALAGLLARTAV